MYLKALEIQGFKSFPDKTRLNFDQEITAIVGPNGSGKSNISDAILWVMGEQRTKTLRGGKMEDVIFGGTEKRSPMGFAQVSLILDNSTGIFDTENTEVMITRRFSVFDPVVAAITNLSAALSIARCSIKNSHSLTC